MADEREWKLGTYRVEEDYSKQTAEVIEKANEFFKDGKVQEAIDTLISMEKTTRLGGDTKSTQKLAKEVNFVTTEPSTFTFVSPALPLQSVVLRL